MLMRLGNPRSIHPDLQQYTFASLAEKAAPPPPAGATQTTIHGGAAPDVMPGKVKQRAAAGEQIACSTLFTD
jgi:hypothetical protein